MKLKDLLGSASSNLGRSKGRTFLTIIAIVIGAFTISLTTGINIGVNDYIDKQINGIGGERQLLIYPEQEQQFGKQDGPMVYQEGKTSATQTAQAVLTDKDLDNLAEIKGLKKTRPLIYVMTDYIKGASPEKFVFNSAPNMDQIKMDMNAGRQVTDDTTEYEVTLASEYVKALGYRSNKEAIGKTVEMAATSLATQEQTVVKAKVVGVANDSIIQGGRSMINQALSEKLLSLNQAGMPSTVQKEYMVAIGEITGELDAKRIDALKERLAKKGYRGETLDDEIGQIRGVINAITSVLTMFGAIALFAASFGIINTLYMSVQERTREIGLMKAMGLSGGKIFTLFSFEATLIGLLGSFFGIGLAMIAGSFINQIATDSFLSSLTGFTLIQFSLPTSGVIVLIISGIAFLSGTLPASRAAKQDPIEALRYE